jgi:hypothetical protein
MWSTCLDIFLLYLLLCLNSWRGVRVWIYFYCTCYCVWTVDVEYFTVLVWIYFYCISCCVWTGDVQYVFGYFLTVLVIVFGQVTWSTWCLGQSFRRSTPAMLPERSVFYYICNIFPGHSVTHASFLSFGLDFHNFLLKKNSFCYLSLASVIKVCNFRLFSYSRTDEGLSHTTFYLSCWVQQLSLWRCVTHRGAFTTWMLQLSKFLHTWVTETVFSQYVL